MPAALVLIDLQPPFLAAVAEADRVLARCRLAAAAFRLLGTPILITEQAPAKLGRTEPSLLAATGESCPTFPKESFSALAAPGFLDALREQEIDHLLIAGVEGPICIHQTAVHAQAEGLGVTILSDAVGARRMEDQRVAFDALVRAGVHLLPVETVLYALMGGADHPRFREVAGLVKKG